MNKDEINLERYKIIREYIAHEDSLINNRLTWLLVAQGLIFSAFSGLFIPMSNLASHLDTNCNPDYEILIINLEKNCNSVHVTINNLTTLQCVLGWLGLLISFISYWGIDAAIQAIIAIEEDYDDVSEEAELPKLTGGGGPSFFGLITPRGIPIVLGFAWFIVILTQNFFLINKQVFNYQILVGTIVGFIIGTTLTVWVYYWRYNLFLDCLTTTSTKNGDTRKNYNANSTQ